MATVYKIEIETVSERINFTPSDIEERIKKAIEKEFGGDGTTDYPEFHNTFTVTEIEVKRTA
jgi:hypothetical protein